MKLLARIIGVSVFTALFLFGKGVLAYESPGKSTGFVNDFAQVFIQDEKLALEAKLSNFQSETSNEISVVTIKTLGGDSIETYATALFREWGIGGKEHNNGVLILAVIDDRKLRIETGYGLEGALPDLLTKQIQESEIIPEFKTGNYVSGLNKGVDAIIQATRGEYTQPKSTETNSLPINLIFIMIFFGFQILISILAPTKSWWLGGVIGGFSGGFGGYLLGSLIFGGIGALLGTGVGLLIDYIVSKNYANRGVARDDFWHTGGFGGSSWGGSSGGFGGFGGGSSGGGGSSSSW